MVGILMNSICLLLMLLIGGRARIKWRSISISMIIQRLFEVLLLMVALYMSGTSFKQILFWLFDITITYYGVEEILLRHTLVGTFSKRYWYAIAVYGIFEGILVLIFNNWELALIINKLLIFTIGLVNYYVYQNRGAELEINDIYAIKTAATILGNYKLKLSFDIICVMCLLSFQTVMEFVCYRDILSGLTISNSQRIIGLLIICITLILVLCFPGMDKIGIRQDDVGAVDGTLWRLLVEWREVISERFKDKNSKTNIEELVKACRSRVDKDIIKKEERTALPNIVVIMNESFSDLTIHGKFETNQKIFPNLEKYKEMMISGRAYTSVLGGNTAYSEYEFLTGNTTRYHKFCPYSNKYISAGDKAASFVLHLKKLNYHTIAFHPYESKNWRRPIVYKAMGFDEQYYQEDVENPELVRAYISDRSSYKKILELLENNKGNGKNQFIFNVTMQNHGGYSNAYNMDKQLQLMGMGEEYIETENYINLLHESDRAFGEFLEKVKVLNEDTIIVMFGDHQPKFTNNFVEKISEDKLNMNEKAYIVPYYIYANYDLGKKADKLLPELSLNYLFEYIFEIVGIPNTQYGRFLSLLREEIPIITKKQLNIRQDANIEEAEEMLTIYEKIIENNKEIANQYIDFFE